MVIAGAGQLRQTAPRIGSLGDETSLPSRLVTPDDLLELRDIGQPDSALFEAQSPLAISPDGKRLAL
jgi:hypothetical protein